MLLLSMIIDFSRLQVNLYIKSCSRDIGKRFITVSFLTISSDWYHGSGKETLLRCAFRPLYISDLGTFVFL